MIARVEEKYARSHLSKPILFVLKVSKIPKFVPRKIATPATETELPRYSALIPPLLTVSLIEPKIVVFYCPMLLDMQFLAC